MAWDKSLPSNSTKIRNYPTVLTDNFASVEEGDTTLQYWKSNYIERNVIPSAPAVDPTRIDNVMQLYSKQNADGLTDLFVIDDRNPANIIQLTNNGGIGNSSITANVNEITFDNGTVCYNENNFITAYGRFNSITSTTESQFACTMAGTFNNLTVTFDTARSTSNYIVVVTIVGGGSPGAVIVGTQTTTQFTIVATSGSHINFMVCGAL